MVHVRFLISTFWRGTIIMWQSIILVFQLFIFHKKIVIFGFSRSECSILSAVELFVYY